MNWLACTVTTILVMSMSAQTQAQNSPRTGTLDQKPRENLKLFSKLRDANGQEKELNVIVDLQVGYAAVSEERGVLCYVHEIFCS